MAPTLSLLGVLHPDRPGTVAGALEDVAATADAVFLEWPESTPGPRQTTRVAVSHPLGLLGAYAMALLYAPVYLVTTRAYEPAERVAARRLDLPTHPVDRHPVATFTDLGWGWTVASWGVLVGLVAIRPVGTAVGAGAVTLAGVALSLAVRWRTGTLTAVVGTGLAVGAGVAVWTGGLPAVATVACAVAGSVLATGRTVEVRNAHMLDRVESIAAEEGYDEVVLVAGKGHLPGLLALAGDRGIPADRAVATRWLRTGLVRVDPDEGGAAGEGAPVGRRVLAGVVDAVIVALLVVAAIGLTPEGLPAVAAVLAWFVGVPVGYFAALESTVGSTPGKQTLGLRVTGEDGEPAGARAALVRNLLRPVDALLGFVLLTTDEGRLGDRVAGTTVRRVS